MMYTMMNTRPLRPEMVADRWLRDVLGAPAHGDRRPPRMGFRVDVHQAGEAYILTAELPGVKLADVDITVQEDVLTISADLNVHKDMKREDFLICERRGGKVVRSFTLEGVQQDAITAAMADGILTITLPKVQPEEGKGPRKIAITAGEAPALAAGAIEA